MTINLLQRIYRNVIDLHYFSDSELYAIRRNIRKYVTEGRQLAESVAEHGVRPPKFNNQDWKGNVKHAVSDSQQH